MNEGSLLLLVFFYTMIIGYEMKNITVKISIDKHETSKQYFWHGAL